jgi:hypothetical protein
MSINLLKLQGIKYDKKTIDTHIPCDTYITNKLSNNITNNKMLITIPLIGDVITELMIYSKTKEISSLISKCVINITHYGMTKCIYNIEEPYNNYLNTLKSGKESLNSHWYNINTQLPIVCLIDSTVECIIEFNTNIPLDTIVYYNYGYYHNEALSKGAHINCKNININEYKYQFISNVYECKLPLSPKFNNVNEIILTTTNPLTTLMFFEHQYEDEEKIPDYYRTYLPYKKGFNISNEFYIYYIPFDYDINMLDIIIYLKFEEKSDIYITGVRDNTIIIDFESIMLKYEY